MLDFSILFLTSKLMLKSKLKWQFYLKNHEDNFNEKHHPNNKIRVSYLK
jgi:hypothetical protein